jgi:hypothetical protein
MNAYYFQSSTALTSAHGIAMGVSANGRPLVIIPKHPR